MLIYSVIVCYKPDLSNLIALCESLSRNFSKVVIVDNTEDSYLSPSIDNSKYVLIELNENTGIAYAQNIGIEHALKNGAEVVVFFDQDSKIKEGFLTELVRPFEKCDVGITAPVLFDDAQNFEFPSLRLNSLGLLTRSYLENQIEPYLIDVTISSGTAVTAEALRIAGVMDEDFFIDFVDTEWFLRCKKLGIPTKIVPQAMMRHSIGEKSINLYFIRIFIHSPIRCYYRIRNSFIFFKKEHVPVLLALKEVLSAIVHHLFLLFFVQSKKEYLRNYRDAIVDGLRGVTGKNPRR